MSETPKERIAYHTQQINAISKLHKLPRLAVVPLEALYQIEDAIAFELCGEPCGLNEAHKRIQEMIEEAVKSRF